MKGKDGGSTQLLPQKKSHTFCKKCMCCKICVISYYHEATISYHLLCIGLLKQLKTVMRDICVNTEYVTEHTSRDTTTAIPKAHCRITCYKTIYEAASTFYFAPSFSKAGNAMY